MVATPTQRLVVIGNGMAGCRAVEEVLARDPAAYRITIFGAEPRVNYNRIMLSPVLAGEKAFEDIVINDAGWYADNAITLVSGDPVVAIDRAAQTVTAASGLAWRPRFQRSRSPGSAVGRNHHCMPIHDGTHSTSAVGAQYWSNSSSGARISTSTWPAISSSSEAARLITM